MLVEDRAEEVDVTSGCGGGCLFRMRKSMTQGPRCPVVLENHGHAGVAADADSSELVSSDAGGGLPSIGPAGMRPPDHFLRGANAPSGLGCGGGADPDVEVKPRLSKID